MLEIGTGSGYSTAMLALLAGEVLSDRAVRRPAPRRARELLDGMGIANVEVLVGDGSAGVA